MSAAQKITNHFGGDWHGSYGMFPSPGHGKSDRGMSIKDADNGDVLINSFNGGDAMAVMDECRRLGLLPERDMSRQRDVWTETGIYEYVGADGTVAYRTKRLEKPGEAKRFIAQRPDGKGGWTNGLGDVARTLYRLPEILAADPEIPVYLTEGERKADKLAAWGFVATAVAFGAKGWRNQYADALEGRTVVILPDNDDPGREFADKVRQSLQAAGARAEIVELPGLPAKGDIIDWKGAPDDLAALAHAALNRPPETLPLADLNLWGVTAPTAKHFIMPGFIPENEITILTGPGGSNKSTFGTQLAACFASQKPMLGVELSTGSALYVTAEDDERQLHWVLQHVCGAIAVSVSSLVGKLHLSSIRGRINNELATFDADGRIRSTPAFALLKATVQQTKAKLIILDNVAHIFAGNENDRAQVTAFINLLYSLCLDNGVSIVLIGHPNKSGDSYSGSTAWLNAVRSHVTIAKPEDTYDPDERLLTVGKANYAREGETLKFRWHDFALVRDADLPPDRLAQIAETAAVSAQNEAFIACLRERASQGDGRTVGPSPGPNYAPSQFEGMAQARGMKKDDLKRAMDRLFSIGRIEAVTVHNRAKGRTLTVIQEVPQTSPNASPNASRTLSPNVPEPAPERPRTHTIHTTYVGAAHEAAAPSRTGEPIFAPGDEDDPDPFDVAQVKRECE
jgi:RecA-family ATPase